MWFQEGRVGLLSHSPIGQSTPVLRGAVHFFACCWIHESFCLPQTGFFRMLLDSRKFLAAADWFFAGFLQGDWFFAGWL
jgi:hypothetical protein